MAPEDGKISPQRRDRVVCENGHFRWNEDDVICRICFSTVFRPMTEFVRIQPRTSPTRELTQEERDRINWDFGLRRCPNGHYYNPDLTRCPRPQCNPPPPRSPPPRPT